MDSIDDKTLSAREYDAEETIAERFEDILGHALTAEYEHAMVILEHGAVQLSRMEQGYGPNSALTHYHHLRKEYCRRKDLSSGRLPKQPSWHTH